MIFHPIIQNSQELWYNVAYNVTSHPLTSRWGCLARPSVCWASPPSLGNSSHDALSNLVDAHSLRCVLLFHYDHLVDFDPFVQSVCCYLASCLPAYKDFNTILHIKYWEHLKEDSFKLCTSHHLQLYIIWLTITYIQKIDVHNLPKKT